MVAVEVADIPLYARTRTMAIFSMPSFMAMASAVFFTEIDRYHMQLGLGAAQDRLIDLLLSTPIRRIRSDCCARATSGHAAAARPISVMNSRRFN